MARIKREMPCGCVVGLDYDDSLTIVYCKQHAAAPELLEACHWLIDHMTMTRGSFDRPTLADVKRKAEKAIARAEGKEGE